MSTLTDQDRMPTTLIDQDRVRWPGSGSQVPGNTAFGFYDADSTFQLDCYNSMVWAAHRLGYPIVDIELIDRQFYMAFEEAVNEYSKEVNQYNIINNIFFLQGKSMTDLGGTATKKANVTGQAIIGSGLSYAINLAKDYGSEVGTGGKVDWKKTSIKVLPGIQDYDLQSLIGDSLEGCDRIEIKKIFHDVPPASARIYDPFSMTGMSYSNVLQELGFGAYSPAVQFLMTPIFEDLLRMQSIEFNDMVRKSAYSFEIKNNKLRIFPIPTYGYNLWLEYINESDRDKGSIVGGTSGENGTPQNVASDFADMPYSFHVYSDINDAGRQWIRNYFLACCKEILGAIRQKIQVIPIAGGDITLDGGELRAESKDEKEKLLVNLREMLEQAGRFNQMEKQSQMAEQLQETLKRVPNFIYVGLFISCFTLITIKDIL
jgi:hypothetical protein